MSHRPFVAPSLWGQRPWLFNFVRNAAMGRLRTEPVSSRLVRRRDADGCSVRPKTAVLDRRERPVCPLRQPASRYGREQWLMRIGKSITTPDRSLRTDAAHPRTRLRNTSILACADFDNSFGNSVKPRAPPG